jgi:predicted RNA-binding Zn-ribbon protein involved in translation (DUF1610 family)
MIGDWICSACGDLQFARNTQCRRCGAAKPAAEAAPPQFQAAPQVHVAVAGPPTMQVMVGDWLCGACGDLQFARNMACRRCGAAKPVGASPPAAMPQAAAG